MNFGVELRDLLNRHSIENNSDTADYILADFIIECLTAFENAVIKRDKFREKEFETAFKKLNEE